MSANSPKVGSRSSVTKPDMWYFDQLPPTAREALANASFNWSSGSMLNRWKRQLKGYRNGREIADRVRAADKSVKPFYQTSNQ